MLQPPPLHNTVSPAKPSNKAVYVLVSGSAQWKFTTTICMRIKLIDFCMKIFNGKLGVNKLLQKNIQQTKPLYHLDAEFVESNYLRLKHMQTLPADEIKAWDFDEAMYFSWNYSFLTKRHGEENNIHVGAIWCSIGIVKSKAKRCKDAGTAC